MSVRVITGDCRDVLAALPDESVHCVVTSPPYWRLRDYGCVGQIGLEATFDEFVAELVDVFREVRRALRSDGTLWLNLGDAYAGSWGAQSRGAAPSDKSTLQGNGHTGGGPKLKSLSAVQIAAHPKGTGVGSIKRTPALKPKDLIGLPWRVAFALQADGWWLRQDIIWSKPNPMPESVTDRCTKAHEYLFMLSKSERYFYDNDAIKEAGVMQPQNRLTPREENPDAKVHGQPMHRRPPGGTGRSSGNDTDATRNKRSVWNIATAPFSEAHFAVFPPALIEPCIKAGTSEKGCCAKCGAPWVRETIKTTTFRGGSGAAGRTAEDANANGKWAGIQYGKNIKLGPTVSSETKGWSPSCACSATAVPCTVLDCFGGAGTTGLVADRHGRNAILIELNPEYAAMAERRIKGDAGMFAVITAEAAE